MDIVTNEICFKQDTAERKQFFKAASFAHPAKMVLGLQIYLIEHYTKPGDTILDPMAGSGTILIACPLGRNVVLVELEDKFVKMQQDNWQKIKSLGPMLGYKMGRAQILQGDARNIAIPDFHPQVDKIVTSPPYAEAQTGGGIAQKGYQGPKHSPTDLIGKRSYMPEQSGRSEGQIGNLPYGEISAVISSPPYAEVSHHSDDPKDIEKLCPNRTSRLAGTAGQSEENIGNLPYKADAVITSPPYEESLGKKHRSPKTNKLEQEKKLPVDYTGLDKSIERLRKHGRADEKAGGPYGQSLAHPYSGATENIGNLKSDNYLEAMLQVYRQCHRVLKDGGLLCLVVKNFIRDKKIVRLDLDTIKLCENAGFILKERLKRKLTSMSFWRIIYHKKFPDVEKIEYEDVLIFAKSKPATAMG